VEIQFLLLKKAAHFVVRKQGKEMLEGNGLDLYQLGAPTVLNMA